jgi:hypothetical protein
MPVEEHFRILCPYFTGSAGVTLHRDTWLGFPRAGFNFWIPVSSTPSATLEFYPCVFNAPVQLENINDLDLLPVEQDLGTLIVPPVEYGQALLFSSRHLHGSAMNQTSHTRVSWDYRLIEYSRLTASRRAGEYAFMDLILNNPDCPTVALQKTRERLANERKYFIYTSHLITSARSTSFIIRTVYKFFRITFSRFRNRFFC